MGILTEGASTLASAAGLATGVAGLATACVMWWRGRVQDRTESHRTETVDRTALAKAVETVQEVYGKLTGDLRAQVDDLIERDRQCRGELARLHRETAELRAEVKSLRRELKEHRG